MRLYLAGPMSGLPHFNFPAFDRAIGQLRLQHDGGFEFISPAELDDPEQYEAAMASPDGVIPEGGLNGQLWSDFLARDVALVAGVDGIILLGDWHYSRGACLEAFISHNLQGGVLLSYPDWIGSTLADAPTRPITDFPVHPSIVRTILGRGPTKETA